MEEGELYVKDLKDKDYVNIQLVIRRKYGIRDYRSKFGKFFVLEAGDRTGNVLVKYWGRDVENTEKFYEELKEGDVIEVQGTFENDDTPYISVDAEYDSLRKLENYDPKRFIESGKNIDEIMGKIMGYVESVREVHLSKLLDLFFSSERFLDEFRDAPASISGAYGYLGGLAEHTLNVTMACEALAKIYSLDRDFLVTAALLHDIGRMDSYEVDTTIKMKNRAKLLGHTVISYNMVEEKIREIVDFPSDMRDRLLHAIIAHHSPIVDNVPQRIRTREAYILFYADMIDLSLKEFEVEGEDEWQYSRRMGREIYLG